MKKNSLTLIIFLLIGFMAGAIATRVLEPVPALKFLTESAEISWHPKADLHMLQYDLAFQVRLNLISILGLVASIWIYRKL